MKKKVYIKPSKPSLVVGLIAIAAMIAFGIFFMTLIAGEEESRMGMVFLSIWLLIALLIAGSMLYNYFSKDGSQAIGSEITFSDEETNQSNGFDERLRKLEGLRRDRLISEEEYRNKRKEIMDGKW
jgi:cation transport ATPase